MAKDVHGEASASPSPFVGRDGTVWVYSDPTLGKKRVRLQYRIGRYAWRATNVDTQRALIVRSENWLEREPEPDFNMTMPNGEEVKGRVLIVTEARRVESGDKLSAEFYNPGKATTLRWVLIEDA